MCGNGCRTRAPECASSGRKTPANAPRGHPERSTNSYPVMSNLAFLLQHDSPAGDDQTGLTTIYDWKGDYTIGCCKAAESQAGNPVRKASCMEACKSDYDPATSTLMLACTGSGLNKLGHVSNVQLEIAICVSAVSRHVLSSAVAKIHITVVD